MTTPTRTNSNPIRVLLVDDQNLVRQGVRSLLSLADGIEVSARPVTAARRWRSSRSSIPTWC